MDKKKKKKLLIISGSIVGGMLILLIIFMFSIGAIVKASVNGILPKITGTPCSIGMCTFNPIMGKVTMKNFIIGNPEGYAHPNAFKMGTLVIDVGMTSLFADKIVIEAIIIDGMEVDFEVKMTETNLSVIKGNVDEFCKEDEVKVKEEKEEKKEEPEAETDAEPAKSKTLQIDLFKFVDCKMIMGTGGGVVPIPLADIIIEDIGNTQEGATVGEVSQKVFYALYESVWEAAKESGADMGGAIKDSTNKMIEGVKGWFGGGKDKKK